MTIPVSNDAHIKNDDKYDILRNIQVNESWEYGFYTIEFPGQLLSELEIPCLEWIKIHD
jgi:hypothetical protein